MSKQQAKPKPPWDAKMAAEAAAIDQAVKLGGVVVTAPKGAGFGAKS